MSTPKHHLFVCASFRANGERQGVCHKKDSMSLLSYLESEIKDRMMDDVEACVTGCLNRCTMGPVLIDYPSGSTYGKINEEAIDAILDAFEEGRVAEEHLVA
jgi:(2Fe-2S) ferredoxin